ncbi:unnamed protein product [Amoebophrya sp. A25]|nr:unnamed protein product [Amoebophrya sp. A25]|eukprot:GSA25T00010021001.1
MHRQLAQVHRRGRELLRHNWKELFTDIPNEQAGDVRFRRTRASKGRRLVRPSSPETNSLFTTTYNYSQRWRGKHIFVHVVIPALLSQVVDVQSRDNGNPSMFDAVGEACKNGNNADACGGADHNHPDDSPETDTIEGEDFAEAPNSLISVAPSGKLSSFTEREAVETSFPGGGLWNLRRDVVADLKDIIVAHQQQLQDGVVNGVVAKLEEVFSDKVSSEDLLQQIRVSHQEQMKELRQDVKQVLQEQQTVISQEIRELHQKVEQVLERVEQHQQQQNGRTQSEALAKSQVQAGLPPQEELNHPPLEMHEIPINMKSHARHNDGVPFIPRDTLGKILRSPNEKLENQEKRNVQVIRMAYFEKKPSLDPTTLQSWLGDDAKLPHLVYRINFVAPKAPRPGHEEGPLSHKEQIKLLTEAMFLQMCRYDYKVTEEVERTEEVKVDLEDKFGIVDRTRGEYGDRLTTTAFGGAFQNEIRSDLVDPPRAVKLGKFNWRHNFLRDLEKYTSSSEWVSVTQVHNDLQEYISRPLFLNSRNSRALEVFCTTALDRSGTKDMAIFRKIVIEFLFIKAEPDEIKDSSNTIQYLNGEYYSSA